MRGSPSTRSCRADGEGGDLRPTLLLPHDIRLRASDSPQALTHDSCEPPQTPSKLISVPPVSSCNVGRTNAMISARGAPMYSARFGMHTNPFLPLSDPDTIFRSTQVRETLHHFVHARTNHHGMFLLAGEVGTGKTTAIQAAVRELPANTPVAFPPPTTSTPSELLEEVCLAVGLAKRARESKAERRRRLRGDSRESCGGGAKARRDRRRGPSRDGRRVRAAASSYESPRRTSSRSTNLPGRST